MAGEGALNLDVDVELVRALLAEQHPDLAELPVRVAASGWDNVMFRIGDDLAARLPHRQEGAPLMDHELAWLPGLLADLPGLEHGGLATAIPLREGRPGCGYPWRWAVLAWLPGEPAVHTPLSDPDDAARRLATFLAALHRPAPLDAPENSYRGVPLADRGARLPGHLDQVAARGRSYGESVRRSDVEAAWATLSAAPVWLAPSRWLHGDLHPANLLVHDGRLSGVVDFGDLTSGDPATDLMVAWQLLPASSRPVLREALREAGAVDETDDATWQRSQAWALVHSVAMLVGSPDGSPLPAMAQRVIAELVALTT